MKNSIVGEYDDFDSTCCIPRSHLSDNPPIEQLKSFLGADNILIELHTG